MTQVHTYAWAEFEFSLFMSSSGGVTSVCSMSMPTPLE